MSRGEIIAASIFSALFLFLCWCSAEMEAKDYHDKLVRRDTWTVGYATVVEQHSDNHPGCFIKMQVKAPNSAPIVLDDELSNNDECRQYDVGQPIRIHYDPGKISSARVYINGSHPEVYKRTAIAMSIYMDFVFAIPCVVLFLFTCYLIEALGPSSPKPQPSGASGN